MYYLTGHLILYYYFSAHKSVVEKKYCMNIYSSPDRIAILIETFLRIKVEINEAIQSIARFIFAFEIQILHQILKYKHSTTENGNETREKEASF